MTCSDMKSKMKKARSRPHFDLLLTLTGAPRAHNDFNYLFYCFISSSADLEIYFHGYRCVNVRENRYASSRE